MGAWVASRRPCRARGNDGGYRGCLLLLSGNCSGGGWRCRWLVFRVYKAKDFTDYKILYDDMVIEIVDDDAVFVGDEYIDATPPLIPNLDINS